MKVMTHCWHDRRTAIEDQYGYNSPEHIETYFDDWCNGTCMLLDGHKGEHVYTPDDQIQVRFKP